MCSCAAFHIHAIFAPIVYIESHALPNTCHTHNFCVAWKHIRQFIRDFDRPLPVFPLLSGPTIGPLDRFDCMVISAPFLYPSVPFVHLPSLLKSEMTVNFHTRHRSRLSACLPYLLPSFLLSSVHRKIPLSWAFQSRRLSGLTGGLFYSPSQFSSVQNLSRRLPTCLHNLPKEFSIWSYLTSMLLFILLHMSLSVSVQEFHWPPARPRICAFVKSE